jgi:proteasome accessory factor B
VPENLDLRSLVRSLTPREPTASAVLAIRAGKAPALRRRGTPTPATVALPGGFEVYSVGYSELRFLAGEVVRYAADVIVLEPVELRNEVRRGLERVTSIGSDQAGAA